MKKLNIKNIFIYSVFLIAFLERTVFNFGPNIELVTMAIVLASFYLDLKKSIFLTFLTLIASDLVLGNTNIFIFTWSGFLIPLLFLRQFKKLKINNIFAGTLAGISSNLFFFIWTNFGVWALDSWGMYPKTILGLINCYINALPFLKNQLFSSLIFIPLGMFLLSFFPNLLYSKFFHAKNKVKYLLQLSK